VKLKVVRLDDSLALQIPRQVATELGLVEGDELNVELGVTESRARPVRVRRTITEMTKGMSAPEGSVDNPWE
jgi:antitoxin component of MazEF toxin-antitoxin module